MQTGRGSNRLLTSSHPRRFASHRRLCSACGKGACA